MRSWKKKNEEREKKLKRKLHTKNKQEKKNKDLVKKNLYKFVEKRSSSKKT